jgi:hypothetical protein
LRSPKRESAIRSAGRAGVGVAEEQQASFETLGDDRGQLSLLVGAGTELGVGVADRVSVPLPRPDGVGLGEVEVALRVDPHERRRVVHHRGATISAGGEVVRQAQRVADLVGRELAQAGERQLDRVVHASAARRIGAGQPLEQQSIVAHAQRAEADVTLDHLAGPRIDDAPAVGPAPRRAVDPLDHVVTRVERVRALGQQLDAEGIDETGGLERCAPPARAVEQRAAHRLRHTAIDVVDDRLAHARRHRPGLHLLQTVPHDPALDERAIERCGVVLELDGERARARIEAPRPVARLGQGEQRVMLHEADRAWIRCDAPHEVSRLAADPGQQRLELQVARKGKAGIEIDGAARRAQIEDALVGRLQPGRHVVRVAHDERGEVDERAAVGVQRGQLGAPQHGGGERLIHGAALGLVRAERAIAEVRLLDEQLAADATEDDEARLAELPAVESDGVRAEAADEPLDVQEATDLAARTRRRRQREPQLAPIHVEPEVEQSGPPLETGRLLHDRRQSFRPGRDLLRFPGRARRRRRQGDERRQKQGCDAPYPIHATTSILRERGPG